MGTVAPARPCAPRHPDITTIETMAVGCAEPAKRIDRDMMRFVLLNTSYDFNRIGRRVKSAPVVPPLPGENSHIKTAKNSLNTVKKGVEATDRNQSR
jgi:hypothetical protein